MSDRGRRGCPDFGHLEGVSTEPEHGQARPQFRPEFQFTDASARYRADPPKDEMLPLSSRWTLQQAQPRTSPEKAGVPGESVGPASRKTKTLDELLLENEQLSQERESSARVSDRPDEEEETCLLLHEPGKAIIDTGCGRCVTGAETHRAKEITWQHGAPSEVFYYGNGTKDRSMGVIDLGGQNMQIIMHVVPG